ncbi:Alanine aminotransferase 2 [Labeo rohita]|uniref:Alanine aminotransferase 2 n=1 Tax=Labeo rohita TaxID=84645 RepID=A0ABQ8LNV2_LABRO|nr:Alanine aminotransferase 2 [Labeo rohita]
MFKQEYYLNRIPRFKSHANSIGIHSGVVIPESAKESFRHSASARCDRAVLPLEISAAPARPPNPQQFYGALCLNSVVPFEVMSVRRCLSVFLMLFVALSAEQEENEVLKYSDTQHTTDQGDPGPCGYHANCTNTPGSYLCSCFRGYLMSAEGCTDVDECALAAVTGLQACGSGAVCTNTPGSFTCSCPPGFVLALDLHNYVDECNFEESCRRELGNVCVNTDGSYTCVCQTGFREDRAACLDVDECVEEQHVCAGRGECENTLGSYRCVCRRGYRGNGTHCTDVDECAQDNGICEHECMNQPGKYSCVCSTGYTITADLHNCTDVDECVSSNDTCEQTCTNTAGSFLCSCRGGYQLHIDGRSCVDIDECKLQNGGCSHECTNTPGGHECHCPFPLLLDHRNTTCVNVTSCALRNGGCDHICSLGAEGRIHCTCRAGWELSTDQRTCIDVDECVSFNGGCEQVCVNHAGGFNCSCRSGFESRKDDPSKCQPLCDPACLNSGVCVAPNTCDCPAGYPGPGCSGSCMRWNVCLCRPGWTGEGCHTAVCELPCANGGRCVAPNTCQCPSDYSGPQCLIPLCSPPCVNGGKCVDINTCSCSDGWTGARCQIAVTTPCVPPCQHGSICGPLNTCVCPTGTSGIRCEKLTCPVVTTVVSMARAVRKGFRESYVDRCGPLGVQLCTKYRIIFCGNFINTTSLLSQRLNMSESFRKILDLSSGDSQNAGIKPITFVRQVIAGCTYPRMLQGDALPPDARLRAQKLLSHFDGGSIGSYTESCGVMYVRNTIAKSISLRDGGVLCSPEQIFITADTQRALMRMLQVLCQSEGVSAVMVPDPAPHTLARLLERMGVVPVTYQLREQSGWSVERAELNRAIQASRGRCFPRTIYISNPGNPTGHVQSRESIQDVIRFAANEELFLLVYQDTVFADGSEFVSYKRVLAEMGEPYSGRVQLASMHSLSNGIMGECGFRTGYMEMVNVDEAVMLYIEILLTGDLCPPVIGQIALDEVASRLMTLKCNVSRAVEFINDLPGFSCQSSVGLLYSRRLLEDQGVYVGFSEDHTHSGSCCHLRLCVLMPSDELEEALRRLQSFHFQFLKEYCDTGETFSEPQQSHAFKFADFMFAHFYIPVRNGKPCEFESASIYESMSRQVKSSGSSMISADDVTAARRSVPFFPVFTTSTCVCREMRRTRARNVRSPPHRCRFSVPNTSSRLVTVVGFHALWMFPFIRVLHQGGMRLTVCALLFRVCRVG